LTLSVNTFHIPWTSGTNACPPKIYSVPTPRLTRVTSFASVLSCATIELTVILRSSISPCASTFTSFPRSPNDTAFVTSEMDRIGRWGLMPFSAVHGRISGAERRRNKQTLTFLVKSADVPWHLDNIAPCLPLSTHPNTVSSKPTMSYFTMSNGHGCPGPAVYG